MHEPNIGFKLRVLAQNYISSHVRFMIMVIAQFNVNSYEFNVTLTLLFHLLKLKGERCYYIDVLKAETNIVW